MPKLLPIKKERYQVHPLRDGEGKPVYVEMAPGEHVVEVPPEVVPKIVVADLVPAGDGTYRLVARRRELYIPLAEAAKLVRFEYRSMLRLVRGGFLESDRPTPNSIRISLASWFEHQERVRRDPEFWSGKNLARFQATL